jgi:HAD superfamily hydrolase (TIGR01484 family)
MATEPNILIRAAALDLDGTIIGPDERITPGVKDAIARLSARIPVFIATGREPHDVFNYARQLGLTGPQLSDGGAAILDPVACKHIWSANLGPELASEVLGLVEDLGANFVATHVQGTFRRMSDIPDWDIVRISALDLSREAAEALTERFQAHPRMTVILASLPYNGLWAVDFTLKGVNKGSGITRMGEMLGVEPTEMACVGDSYNDLPMLRVCGLPIAMGGAPEEVRQAAQFDAPMAEEDGLAFAIDNYILPRVD